MKYDVIILPEALKQINNLDKIYRNELLADYMTIKNVDIEAVVVNSLGNKLYEVKSQKVRSIFEYRKGQIIVIALVFLKKSQKCPTENISKAKKLLEKYKEL